MTPMSAALAIVAPTSQPDPDREGTVVRMAQPDPDRAGTALPAPGRVARLLRQVIDYGKELLIAVRVRATTPDFTRIARPFGTTDLNAILARIAAAISRAAYLETELRFRGKYEQAAAEAAEAAALSEPRAMPADALPADHAAAPPEDQDNECRDDELQDSGRQDNERLDSQCLDNKRQDGQRRDNGHQDKDRRAPGLPTIAEIAAELRRRPIGAVIADICRELGITSEHPLWPELAEVIKAYGGSIAQLLTDEATRWCSKRWMDWPFPRTFMDVPMAVFWQLQGPCPYEIATGPP